MRLSDMHTTRTLLFNCHRGEMFSTQRVITITRRLGAPETWIKAPMWRENTHLNIQTPALKFFWWSVCYFLALENIMAFIDKLRQVESFLSPPFPYIDGTKVKISYILWIMYDSTWKNYKFEKWNTINQQTINSWG